MQDLFVKINDMLELGFTIDYNGLIYINKSALVYEVSWVSYYNPHDNFEKEERSNFVAADALTAINFFLDKLNVLKSIPPDKGSWSI